MKHAHEMKNASIEVRKGIEQAEKDRAGKYAEDVVMPAIENGAKDGEFKTSRLQKNKDINWHHLRHYIESFGYKVESVGSAEFIIYW